MMMKQRVFSLKSLVNQSPALVKNNQKGLGFTLVEISVVIGIISLLALISIPALISYQKTTALQNEARSISSNLRLAQQLAITEQSIHDVEFSIVNNSYEIINAETSETVKTIEVADEISIDSITDLTGSTVSFNPTGAVTETGTITLINSKDQTATIEIKPSGYVEIAEQL